MRFFQIPDTPTGVVCVASSVGLVPSSAYNFDEGFYRGAGGAEFTASATATVDDDEYVLAGYTVEKWDAELQTWAFESSHVDGNSWTCPSGDGWASRRLTWKWNRLNTLNAYDVGDYVQSGLVAHFDAIDNEGTGTHNPSAAVWRDLKGSASLTLTGGAGWTGRYFDSSADLQKFAAMPAFQRNSIPVETAINIVSNGNRSASGTVYPRIFNAPRCTLHSTGNTSTQFRFYMSDAIPGDNNSSRPTTPSFRSATVSCYSGSEYFAVALDAVQKAKTSKPATAYLSIGGGEWSLNGPDGYLHGHYYALRMYNRMLSMGEMATNAVIDKLRFWSYTRRVYTQLDEGPETP